VAFGVTKIQGVLKGVALGLSLQSQSMSRQFDWGFVVSL